MAGKIQYTIGFNADTSQLDKVKQQLQQIQDFKYTDLKLINSQATLADLQEIQRAAQVTGQSLNSAYNPKTGAINIQKFNQELANSGQSVASLSASFAKAGIQGQNAFRNVAAQVMQTGFQLKQTSGWLTKMGETLGNTIKWSIASGAINAVTGAVRNAWGYTKSLDKSLNDIRIVTEKSAEDMDKFADKANKAAKALGTATTAYTKASLIYYQQGLGEEDVQARTEVTLKAANVTGQSAAEVSEQLTAVWNGYRVVAEEAETYIDKLAAVAASTASDLEELSDGMSKVASGANAMGVDIDQLTAQLSTIISVTRQDASSVGTALKTIFARLGDLKVDGVDEFGVSLGEISGTLKKVGIDVLDQEGNLRDMGIVMEEVAGKWGTWTEAQQQAVAVAMAGKRQYNNLLALFENWDMYESALTTSKGSAGTLQKQQDTYTESLEAHLNQLSTAGEKVYKAIFDSESMKDFIDVITMVVDQFGSFINSIGGGGNLLLMFGTIATRVFSTQIANGLTNFITNIQAAKYNVSQLQAEMAMQEQFGANLDKQGLAYKKCYEMKKEELKYQKYLTQEQRDQYDAVIKQQYELENTKDTYKETADILSKEYAALTGKTGQAIVTESVGDVDNSEYVAQRTASLKQESIAQHDVVEQKQEVVDNIDSRMSEIEQENDEMNLVGLQNAKERDELEQANKAMDLDELSTMTKLNNVKNDEKEGKISKEEADQQKKALEDKIAGYEEERKRNQERIAELDQSDKDIIDKVGANTREKIDLKTKRETAATELEQETEKATNIDNKYQSVLDSAHEVSFEEMAQTFKANKDTSLLLSGKLNEKSEVLTEEERKTFEADSNKLANIDSEAAALMENTEMDSSEKEARLNELMQQRLDIEKEYGPLQEKANTENATRISQLDALAGAMDENNLAFSEETKEKLNALEASDEYADVLKKVKKGQTLTAKETKKYKKFLNEADKVVQENSNHLEENGNKLKKLQKEAKDAADAEGNLKKRQEEMNKTLDTKVAVDGMVKLASGVGQVVSGFSALANLGNIWSDENLTGGEKFQQTLSALAMAIPMIITGIQGMITGFTGLTTAMAGQNSVLGLLIALGKAKKIEDKQEIANNIAKKLGIEAVTVEEGKSTIAKLAQAFANKIKTATDKGETVGIWAKVAAYIAEKMAAAPVLVITLLIVAAMLLLAAAVMLVVAVIQGLTKAFNDISDNGESAFKAAQEEAKQATEAFNEAKQAVEDLKKSLEDYNNSQKAIEELTKGTEEWKDAIAEANMQVIDLIDKYPELAQYVTDVDGQLKISEEGQEKAIEAAENKMNQANRNRMLQNIQLAKAENSMIQQKGANRALKTDEYANKALGGGIATLVTGGGLSGLGPLGVIAGIGHAIYNDNESKRREEAYNNALTAIEKNGNSILGDYEAFAQAMRNEGVNDDLISALWENKTELAKNSAEIAANNAAIRLQQQQIAKSYLEEKSKTYQESQYQDSMSKLIAKQGGEDSQAYKDELAKLHGGDGKYGKEEGKQVANEYFATNGITATGVEYDEGSGMVTYYDENGEEKKMSAKVMAESIAQERALGKAGSEENLKKLENNLNNIADSFEGKLGTGKDGSVAKAMTSFVAGERADLSALTAAEVNNLDGLVDKIDELGASGVMGMVEQLKADQGLYTTDKNDPYNQAAAALGFADYNELNRVAKELGYETGTDYINAIQTSVDNYNYTKLRITDGMSDAVKASFTELEGVTKEFSLATQRAIANSLDAAFKNSGPAASKALQQFYAEIGDGLSEEDYQALTKITEEIDWTSSSAVLEFKNKISELNGTIDPEILARFTGEMDGFVNVVANAVANLDSLVSKLKSLKDSTEKLNIGDVISNEDYEKLTGFNKELEKYFLLTVDGAVYLGGGEQAFKDTKKAQLDLNKFDAQYTYAERQGNALVESGTFNKNARTKDQKRAEVEELVNSGEYNDLLAASGINPDLITDYLGTGLKTSSIDLGSEDLNNKLGTYTLNSLKDFQASDLVKKLGLKDTDDETAEQIAQRIIDDAITQTKTASEYVQGAYDKVLGNVNNIENGTFNETKYETLIKSLSSFVSTYDELKDYESTFGTSEEGIAAYTKYATGLLAQEASQLGINTMAWEKLTAQEGFTIEKQNEYLDNLRRIQAYDEIDYYKDITEEIEELESALDKLSEAQERLTGKELIANLQKQAELQDELVKKQKEKFALQQEEWKLRRKEFDAQSAVLQDYGISGISYDEEGKISDTSRAQLIAAYEKALAENDTNAIEYFSGLIEKADEFNDSITDGLEENSDAIREAYQTKADLLLEAFNTDVEMHLDLEAAKREWQDFKNSMYKGEGLKFFEEESALETINNAVSRSESLTSSFNTAANAMNDASKTYADAKVKEREVVALYNEELGLKTDYETAVKNREKAESDYATAVENEKKAKEEAEKATAEREKIDAKIAKNKEEQARLETRKQGLINDRDEKANKALELYKKFQNTDRYTYDSWGTKSENAEWEKNGQKFKEYMEEIGVDFMEFDQMMVEDYLDKMKADPLTVFKDKVNTAGYNDEFATIKDQTKELETEEKELVSEQAVAVDKEKTANRTANATTASTKDVDDKKAIEEREKAEYEAKKTERQNKVDEIMKSGNRYITIDENGNAISNDAQYKEDMEGWLETAQDTYSELQEEAQNIYEAYLTAQEEIMGAFDELTSKLSSINDILRSQADLIKLAGKNAEGTGARVTKMYTAARENAEKNYLLSMTQLQAAQEEYDKLTADGVNANSEQLATVLENLQTSTENMLEMASEYSAALAEEYGMALTGIIDDYLTEITGMDLESATQDWELAVKQDERYVDDVNTAYAMNELDRKFQKSIDETDSYTAQKKLAEERARQEEKLNKILAERGKLSQYELDRANAEYELTLKQIALEEAQQTATKMKLTRDASGNYSYQYVQDQDAVAKAQEELDKARNDLYNLDKDRNKELVDEYYSIWSEMQEEMSAAEEAGDTERLAKLQEYYFGPSGILTTMKDEMGIAQENLEGIGKVLGGADWVSPFKNFTDAIAKSDLGVIATSIATLTEKTSANMQTAASVVDKLLSDEEGPLLKATKTLETSVSDGIMKLGPKLQESMEASTKAIGELTGEDGLLAQINTLGTTLTGLGDTYQQWLNKQVTGEELSIKATEDNTAATQQLTNAMYNYLDKLDGKEDGQYGSYQRNNDGDWMLTTNAGGDNPST